MEGTVFVNRRAYRIIRLLGHGKGGYSYLAEAQETGTPCTGRGCPPAGGDDPRMAEKPRVVVLKQIHHEPCDYYHFGDKIEAERRDYQRLTAAGIRIPKMLDIDMDAERIVKEYIEGDTVFDLVKKNQPTAPYMGQIREMSAQARAAGLNIDYFPTNFVARDGIVYYIDYECNAYMDKWSFENWGIRYWSRTPEFEAYLAAHENGQPAAHGNDEGKEAEK